MEGKLCRDCENYLQHYTLIDGKLGKVYCGHCKRFMKRRIRPDGRICDQFIPGQPLEKTMVSKQYLTKALLQRIFNIELFPESEE